MTASSGPGSRVDGLDEPGLAARARGLDPDVADPRGVMAALGAGFQKRDLDEQAPELRRAVDPEFTLGAAAEEGAEDRLHDVVAVEPAGELCAQVLLGDPGQPPGKERVTARRPRWDRRRGAAGSVRGVAEIRGFRPYLLSLPRAGRALHVPCSAGDLPAAQSTGPQTSVDAFHEAPCAACAPPPVRRIGLPLVAFSSVIPLVALRCRAIPSTQKDFAESLSASCNQDLRRIRAGGKTAKIGESFVPTNIRRFHGSY